MPDEAVFVYYARLERLKRYVDQNLSEPITLQTAAEVAGLEQKYFSAFFQRKTGVGFREWLNRLRVRRAGALLEQNNLSITELAQEVGFQDLRTFERAFKKHKGMTPVAFKNTVRPG